MVEKVSNPGGLTTYRYEYDARGRISHVSSTSKCCHTLEIRYTYDDVTGLLTKSVEKTSTGDRYSSTFAYDAQRRPVHFVLLQEPAAGPPSTFEDTFLYVCPARPPFDEVLAKMETFKAKACACTDHACSARVTEELEQWQTHMDPAEGNDNQFIQYGNLTAGIEACRR